MHVTSTRLYLPRTRPHIVAQRSSGCLIPCHYHHVPCAEYTRYTSLVFCSRMASTSASTSEARRYVVGGGRSEEEKTFDRQLRLWGPHGQMLLRTSRLLCLGSGAVISETLKSIVLPSIGGVHIVDDTLQTAEDVGNNFFVEESTLGQPRSIVVGRLMSEMNPRVCVQATVVKPNRFIDELLKDNNVCDNADSATDAVPDAQLCIYNEEDKSQIVLEPLSSADAVCSLSSYQAVLVDVAMVPQDGLIALDEAARAVHVPMVLVHCFGLLGGYRLSVPEHAVVETHHNDPAVTVDLALHPRQLARFPALVSWAFSGTFDLLNFTRAEAVEMVQRYSEAKSTTSSDSTSLLPPVAFIGTFGASAEDLDQYHSRIPFIVILIRALFKAHAKMVAHAAAAAASNTDANAASSSSSSSSPKSPADLSSMSDSFSSRVPHAVPLAALKAEITSMTWYGPAHDLREDNFVEAQDHARFVSAGTTSAVAARNLAAGALAMAPPAIHPLVQQILDDPCLTLVNDADATPSSSFYSSPSSSSSTSAPSPAATQSTPTVVTAPVSSPSLPFWLLVGALKPFVASPFAGNGCLPLLATVPDMTCATQTYLTVKKLFREQAEKDAAIFTSILRRVVDQYVASHAQEEGLPFSDYAGFLKAVTKRYGTEDPVKYFLSGCRSLRLSRLRSLQRELDPSSEDDVEPARSAMRAYDENEDDDGMHTNMPYNTQWYLAYRSCLRFKELTGRLPGSLSASGSWETDADQVATIHASLHSTVYGAANGNSAGEAGAESKVGSDSDNGGASGSAGGMWTSCSRELARQGCREIHTTAAVVGGMAADATLKLVMRQYAIPNNMVLYNGVHGIGSVFEV